MSESMTLTVNAAFVDAYKANFTSQIIQISYKFFLHRNNILFLHYIFMLFMVHNHPSGDPAPSKADIEMTHEVRDAGSKLGIVLHDHLIMTKAGYSSFKDLGLP